MIKKAIYFGPVCFGFIKASSARWLIVLIVSAPLKAYIGPLEISVGLVAKDGTEKHSFSTLPVAQLPLQQDIGRPIPVKKAQEQEYEKSFNSP